MDNERARINKYHSSKSATFPYKFKYIIKNISLSRVSTSGDPNINTDRVYSGKKLMKQDGFIPNKVPRF